LTARLPNNSLRILITMKINVTACILCLASAGVLAAQGPAFDSSGNGRLSGTYYFRHVVYSISNSANPNDGTYGDIENGVAVYGNISFDGKGNFSIVNGIVMDSDLGAPESLSCWLQNLNSGCTSISPVPGIYSLSAAGFGFLTNVITGDQISGLVGANGVFSGSSTETNFAYNDLFIAAPLASPAPTIGTFNGMYTVAGFVPFPGSSALYSEDVLFQLNPNGAGNLGGVNVTGYQGGTGGATLSQSFSNLTYSFSSGAGVINFPTSETAQFFSGPEYMYFAPDGNFFFGGSPLGWDMIVGVSNAGTPGFGGLYYESGIDEDFSQLSSTSTAFIDGYYGGFNAAGSGDLVAHERVSDTLDGVTFGETFPDTFPPGVNGPYTDSGDSVEFVVGDGGTVRIGQGIGPYLGLKVALKAPALTPTSSVWINPAGVVNAGNFGPFTAGVSDGEFLTIYGNNLAPTTVVSSTVPYPINLAGVQVLVNGVAAPIYYVSQTQISIIAPSGNTFAVVQFQVNNNGTLSNVVTELSNDTTPGVFTITDPNGTAYGALVHAADGSLVSSANPAQPGEYVEAFLTGLGTVYPAVPDGSAPPLSPLSYTTNAITADLNATNATVAFAGLAPELAGLYQMNVQIPITAEAGDNYLGITGPDSYTQTLIPVGTLLGSKPKPGPKPTPHFLGQAGAHSAHGVKRSQPSLHARR
jgi:uncharacterized protein (TIGR03437 family)